MLEVVGMHIYHWLPVFYYHFLQSKKPESRYALWNRGVWVCIMNRFLLHLLPWRYLIGDVRGVRRDGHARAESTRV